MLDLNDLINAFSSLPGIGKKSATRIALFLLNNKKTATELALIINETIENITNCSVCGNYTLIDPCVLCNSSTRNENLLCVIETPRDLQAIEDTGYYNGRYHILMGSINPLEGQGPEKLRIKELINRVEKNKFTEILLATNPTNEGEATFLYLVNILSKYNIKISKIATGVPMGGSLEYSDKLTLSKAIQSKLYLK